MRKLLKPLSGSTIRRLTRGVTANAFGQGVTIAVQVASLPAFLYFWGPEQYGEWVLLSAAPSYFAMADLGLVGAAAARMTMLVAAKRDAEANKVFQSVLASTAIAIGVIALVAAVVLFEIHPAFLAVADRKWILYGLILLALATVLDGVFESVFVASGAYALGTYASHGARLLDWVGMMLGLLCSSGSMLACVAGALLARVASTLAVGRFVARRYPAFRWGFGQASMLECRRLSVPAVALVMFPLSSALSIQGFTVLAGTVFGPLFLALFTTYRTLSRVVIQAIGVLGYAYWPEFARLRATGTPASLRRAFMLANGASLALTLVVAAALHQLGPWILLVWTSGKVPFDRDIFDLFLTYTTLGAAWLVPRTFLIASNQHAALSLSHLLVSAGALGLAALMSSAYAQTGLLIPLVTQEALMLAISFYVCFRALPLSGRIQGATPL